MLQYITRMQGRITINHLKMFTAHLFRDGSKKNQNYIYEEIKSG